MDLVLFEVQIILHCMGSERFHETFSIRFKEFSLLLCFLGISEFNFDLKSWFHEISAILLVASQIWKNTSFFRSLFEISVCVCVFLSGRNLIDCGTQPFDGKWIGKWSKKLLKHEQKAGQLEWTEIRTFYSEQKSGHFEVNRNPDIL